MKSGRITCLLIMSTLAVAGCAGKETKKSMTSLGRIAVSQQAEQRIQEFNRAQLEQTKHYETLATAVRQEPRNEAWAKEMELKLQKTYAESTRSLPGTLKEVSCRSSKCELQLETSYAQSPEAYANRRQTIDQWIAWSQPCGFIIVERVATQGKSEPMRIFIDCAN